MRQVGELLGDWRRVNVAVTRARSKLVMLGAAPTLRASPLLARLLDLVEAQVQKLCTCACRLK